MDGVGALQLSEISMKQKPIHSQTTAILFQHPTPAEQQVSRVAIIKAHLRDALIMLIIAIIGGVLFYLIGNLFAAVFSA